MSIVIKSFEAHNFRLFRKLRVDELRGVNLFVGKNNAGKSALLEAIDVYANRASPELLFRLVKARQEAWARPYDRVHPWGEANPVRHLFHGHHFPLPDEDGIQLSGASERLGPLRISTGANVREALDDGTVRRVRVQGADFFSQRLAPDVEYALVLDDETGSRWLMDLERDPSRRRSIHKAPDPGLPVQVLPTGSLDQSTVSTLWDRISLTESEHMVMEALRLLDHNIEGVALVEDHSTRPRDRIPIIRTAQFREPVPLSSMGDGMTRVFQLVLALVNARGGVLLVDEFENGLHWSVQSSVWELIWRLAYSLDVQVFASTHSRDCVRAFADVWQRSPNDGSFYRLERDSREIVTAHRYRASVLLDSITSGVEMR